MRATTLSPLLLLAMVFLGATNTVWPCMSADKPNDKSDPPSTVFWHCQLPNGGPSTPPQRIKVGRFQLSYLRIDSTKTPDVGTLNAGFGRVLPAVDGSSPLANITFHYEISVGESLPMLDAMYQVTDLTGQNDVALKRIVDKEYVKNLGDDLDSIIVPVSSGIRYLFYESGRQLDDTSVVHVVKVMVGDGAGKLPRVRLSYENATSRRVLGLPQNVKQLEFAVGDVLSLVKNCELTVKKIVPPDDKHKIRGWIEFDPNPAKPEKK